MDTCIHYHEISNKVILSDGPLIVTEKIDGSNLGIGFLNNNLRIQSRNKILDLDTKFMNFHQIKEPLISFIKDIKKELNYNFIVYGEIFQNEVIKGMYYKDTAFNNKTVSFRAFDIFRVDDKTYLKYSDAIKIFEKVGIPYVPLLNITYNTIDDLYSLVETYKSAYSEKPVEGFVLKKDKEELKYTRTIFKVKRMAYNESGNVLYKYRPRNYVNENRLRSAYSKIGDDRKEIEKEMIKDALKDIMTIYDREVRGKVETLLSICKTMKNMTMLKQDCSSNKFQIDNFVNFAKFQAVYAEMGDDFEGIRHKLIQDALKEIEMTYHSELEAEVQKLIKKRYKQVCK